MQVQLQVALIQTEKCIWEKDPKKMLNKISFTGIKADYQAPTLSQ